MNTGERLADCFLLVAAIAVLTLSPASARAHSASGLPKPVTGLIEDILRVGKVPGASIAVVKDDQVVMARGYGVRELGKPDRVDAETIFDAASLTKSFTAALVATLVDEGKVSLDDPVRRYLPSIDFPEPYLTSHVTLRDLLTHRTGLRATDSAWYFTSLTRPQVLGLVKNLKVDAPFRTRLIYSNIGYTVAGEAAAAAAGEPYEALISRRFLLPLGMTRSTAQFDAAPSMGNVASPHDSIAGVQSVVPRETTRRSTAPAGTVQSSARDLAIWLRFQLGDGSYQGRRIISPEQMAEMHSPHIVVPTTGAFRTLRQVRFFVGYGLGWQVFDYRGRPMLWHSGGGDGQRAYMAILPEQKVGVAVLVNSKVTPPETGALIASRIFDHYLGETPRDYLAEFAASMGRRERATAEVLKANTSSLPNAAPSGPLSVYAGIYRDSFALDVRVWVEGSQLRLTYGNGEPGVLEHLGHDTFRVHWQNPYHDDDDATRVSFVVEADAKANLLVMRLLGDEVEARRRSAPSGE